MTRIPLEESVAQAVSERLSVGWCGVGYGCGTGEQGRGFDNGVGYAFGDYEGIGFWRALWLSIQMPVAWHCYLLFQKVPRHVAILYRVRVAMLNAVMGRRL